MSKILNRDSWPTRFSTLEPKVTDAGDDYSLGLGELGQPTARAMPTSRSCFQFPTSFEMSPTHLKQKIAFQMNAAADRRRMNQFTISDIDQFLGKSSFGSLCTEGKRRFEHRFTSEIRTRVTLTNAKLQRFPHGGGRVWRKSIMRHWKGAKIFPLANNCLLYIETCWVCIQGLHLCVSAFGVQTWETGKRWRIGNTVTPVQYLPSHVWHM